MTVSRSARELRNAIARARADQVLQMLIDAANAGLPCPSNAEFMGALKCCARHVYQALEQLQNEGRVVPSVRQRGRGRVLYIPEIGKGTAAKSAVASHAEAPPVVMPAAPPHALAAAAPPWKLGAAASAPAAPLFPARTCQWPTWPHDAKPPRGGARFCGAPTVAGASYCHHHHALAFLVIRPQQDEAAA